MIAHHRYELEQQLLAGDISIQEVPRLWNEKMTEYLGCTPKDDAQGVLQDVHWSAGIMGYFPTYSLGAMYACQIYQVCTCSLVHASINLEPPISTYALHLRLSSGLVTEAESEQLLCHGICVSFRFQSNRAVLMLTCLYLMVTDQFWRRFTLTVI